MTPNEARPRHVPPRSKSAPPPTVPPPVVSGRWLLGAIGLTLLAAVLCAWGALCLLFWQGSWQLLYHPTTVIARTPASVGLAFDSVKFAATETGELQLQGWWIPAAPSASPAPLDLSTRYTVLYLHDKDGDLADTVDALARLHAAGVNVFAFDYRGYGQSEFARPSETRWQEDAAWALQYLEGTRHTAPASIVLAGTGLGGNLALEVAAQHPELAGLVLDSPLQAPMKAVFEDGRAHMVPAHLLVSDRYDLNASAAALRIPSLWIVSQPPEAYGNVSAPKTLAQSAPSQDAADAVARWLAGLPPRQWIQHSMIFKGRPAILPPAPESRQEPPFHFQQLFGALVRLEDINVSI